MNIDIYDYARKLDGNEHVSYYNVFKVLLKDIDCIVCKKSIDTQILLETMANYYCEHNDSYSFINPPLNILDKFNYYSKEAKKYYETGL